MPNVTTNFNNRTVEYEQLLNNFKILLGCVIGIIIAALLVDLSLLGILNAGKIFLNGL